MVSYKVSNRALQINVQAYLLQHKTELFSTRTYHRKQTSYMLKISHWKPQSQTVLSVCLLNNVQYRKSSNFPKLRNFELKSVWTSVLRHTESRADCNMSGISSTEDFMDMSHIKRAASPLSAGRYSPAAQLELNSHQNTPPLTDWSISIIAVLNVPQKHTS